MAEKKRGPGRPPGSKNKSSRTKSSAGTGSKAREKAQEIQSKKKADRRVIDEIWAIISIALGVFLIVATFTEGAGQLGEMIGDFLKGLFGFMAYVLPFYLIVFGILLFTKKAVSISVKTTLLLLLLLLMLSTMNSIRFVENYPSLDFSLDKIKEFYTAGVTLKSGGFFGMILATLLIKGFGTAGCWIFSLVVSIICLLLIINTPVSRFIGKIGDKMEARKLAKEHSYLDADENVIEEGRQVTIDDMKKKAADRNAMPPKKSEIKIVDGRAASFDTKEADADIHEGSAAQNNNAADEKNSVLKYMKDDSLFGRDNVSGGFGLEESSDFGSGYGVDGKILSAEVSGFGLDKPSSSMAGRGLADSASSSGQIPDENSILTGDEEVSGENKKISNKEAREAMLSAEEINIAKLKKYKKPPVNLLKRPEGGVKANNRLLTEKAQKLEETLKNFHVDARVMQVTQGPTVTRYEIQPAVGVKVNSIVRLADDIALNLEAKSIRIEAPIPGKPR